MAELQKLRINKSVIADFLRRELEKSVIDKENTLYVQTVYTKAKVCLSPEVVLTKKSVERYRKVMPAKIEEFIHSAKEILPEGGIIRYKNGECYKVNDLSDHKWYLAYTELVQTFGRKFTLAGSNVIRPTDPVCFWQLAELIPEIKEVVEKGVYSLYRDEMCEIERIALEVFDSLVKELGYNIKPLHLYYNLFKAITGKSLYAFIKQFKRSYSLSVYTATTNALSVKGSWMSNFSWGYFLGLSKPFVQYMQDYSKKYVEDTYKSLLGFVPKVVVKE